MNPILFLRAASPSPPMTCFFTKIVCRISVKHKRGEFNPFLPAEWAHLPLWSFFFYKNCMVYYSKSKWGESNPFFVSVASPPTFMTFFLQKSHGIWESNINKMNSNCFFCKRIEPTLPYHLLLKKIAKWGRVKRKWGESNIFSKAASPHAPMTSFFLIQKWITCESYM